ncbi:N-acetylneuraminate synthase [Plebeiibacterium marinum]|nr:N-acetylneuraminate synthase [Plebeiobacterium marinum]
MHTIIIAEAGVNHNGDINIAKKLIEVAAECGVDYVKFQTFKADKLVSKSAKQAEYQSQNIGITESQYEMLKRLELSIEDHYLLIKHCKDNNIGFLSTGFDSDSLNFLKEIGMELWKIPSGEITNLPYLKFMASQPQSLVLSTGMATIDEVEDAVNVLTKFGKSKKEITVLHCTTEYPAPFNEVNLKAMKTMADTLGVKTGYSDHTQGIEIPIAAAALGATLIEKHFTLDRNMPGPDHKASIEPCELKSMVDAIRNIEQALGDGNKKPSASEIKNIQVARKSIHVNKELEKRHILREQDLEMKRPGDGISPMKMDEVIGKTLKKTIGKGSILKWEDIE